jgi:hypothetical protein
VNMEFAVSQCVRSEDWEAGLAREQRRPGYRYSVRSGENH